jgi:hypothetical protein
MTENQWLSATDPAAMLDFLVQNGKASNRKLRLYACACAKDLPCWSAPDEKWAWAFEVSELFAVGLATEEQLRLAREAALEHQGGAPRYRAWVSALSADIDEVMRVPACAAEASDLFEDEVRADECSLLRELFGNPTENTSHYGPRWRTGQVQVLAQGMYDARAFDRMLVLAAALEEAGCTDVRLLEHLRGPGPHARGCWALDIVLGKD